MTDKELDELADRVSNALDVPDPSPLFWERFPARVRAAVAAEPAAAPVAPARWWRRRPALVFASLAVAGALSVWAWTWRAPMAGDGATAAAPAALMDASVALMDDDQGYAVDIETDDAGWQVVTAVAATAGLEAVREAGFGVTPGGADAAIEDLDAAERAQLMALLQAEMNGDAGGS